MYFEDGAVAIGGRGLCEEAIAGGVLGRRLIVELHVVPVDERTNFDVHVNVRPRSVRDVIHGREPRSNRCVSNEVMWGSEVYAKSLGQCDQPLLCRNELLSDSALGLLREHFTHFGFSITGFHSI